MKRRNISSSDSAVKQWLKEYVIPLEYVRFEKNLADPLIKGLTSKSFLIRQGA